MTNTIIGSGAELNFQQMASGFQVVHSTPGRLRLRSKDTSFKPAVKTFAQILRQQEGVGEVKLNEKTGSLVVTFDRNKLSQTQILALLGQLGVSQIPASEEKQTDYFAAWKSVEFWKEQGLDLIPLATGLAVTSGLRISGFAAIGVYMFAAEATRQGINVTRDAWLEVMEEKDDKGDKGDKGDKREIAGEAGEENTNYQLPITNYQSKIQNPKSKIFTPYKIVHAVPGRIRFNVPRLAKDPGYAQRVQKLLKADAAIASFRVNRDAASIAINYHPSEGISASHWIDLLQKAEAETWEPNKGTTAPTEQETEIDSQSVVSADTISADTISADTIESDAIDFTLLPQPEEIKAIETTNSWMAMKPPALNASLAFMANFPLQTVPE